MLRTLLAANASPLTLDGTRTYLIGYDRVAVIDPGPDLPDHVAAIAGALSAGGAENAPVILLTHAHPDHAAGAAALAARTGAAILDAGNLRDGERIPTDAGDLVALHTPGHTHDHFAFHWPDGDAAFVGDLMMGGMETALVAAPEGDVGAYLRSLERIARLDAAMLYPAHGPPFTEPKTAIAAYVRHRVDREWQVMEALRAGAVDAGGIVAHVYGQLEPALAAYAAAAVQAYLGHLRERGLVERTGHGWVLVER